MTGKVVIVDYGVGNLVSVARAVAAAGAEAVTSADPKEIETADRLLLPGVGAFGHCMDEINRRSLLEPIHGFARTQRPFMGICVGMQIMFEVGNEFGCHLGLGLVKGSVNRIDLGVLHSESAKLPVIGWRKLQLSPANTAKMAAGLAAMDGAWFYFLHSYAAAPIDQADRLATYRLGDGDVVAAVAKDNLLGLQFHPEKSGPAGISVFTNFLKT
ncbi:imidazole glycerol phosphate synthase subunit HisH [Dongia rigui]|uniref:Imidazole glycerol phosphate synthase subunit HisH n=1 Tax=Dongia rigui TaxID=940149 RepID=A0ABU5E269_9PROT|nr:imidazole glycerol phosphate synthase subunit HisH [Dongia rigui]MDY0873651.1 imidazole glycerol phosphate synthase subunit HisH [Dongia rigui]